MRQITVEIEEVDCEKLDRWAEREGRKRGNLARRIIVWVRCRPSAPSFYVVLDILECFREQFLLCRNDLTCTNGESNRGGNPREIVWEWSPARSAMRAILIVPGYEAEVFHAPLLMSFGSVLSVKNGPFLTVSRGG